MHLMQMERGVRAGDELTPPFSTPAQSLQLNCSPIEGYTYAAKVWALTNQGYPLCDVG
jgi:hypothetical protein